MSQNSRAKNKTKKQHYWHNRITDEWFERATLSYEEALEALDTILTLTNVKYKAYRCPDCHGFHIKREGKNAERKNRTS